MIDLAGADHLEETTRRTLPPPVAASSPTLLPPPSPTGPAPALPLMPALPLLVPDASTPDVSVPHPAVAPPGPVESSGEPIAPALLTGPDAILSIAATTPPADTAPPSLPQTVAHRPSPSAGFADAVPFGPAPVAAHRSQRKQRGAGRRIAALVVVAGLAYGGVVFGPELYDEYIASDASAEPAAPLAFPSVRAGATAVRTATFVLDGLPTSSDATYTITVDFDTWVSRVVIDRVDDAPDLEVLTFSEDALVRRLDSDDWFQLDRGSFPFDEQLQRTAWIRGIDDLLPVDRRGGVVIEESTESIVGGVTTRHLVLTIDPSVLDATSVDPSAGDGTMDPIADLSAAVDPAVADVASQAPGDASSPEALEPITSSAPSALVDEDDAGTDGTAAEPVRVELWIDGQGLVRKSLGADVLGAQDITLLETRPDAWVPDYPTDAQVAPMTAGALLELGL